MKPKLSTTRRRLGLVLSNTGSSFTVAEVAQIVGLGAADASKLLCRWAAQGWVARLRQGLYSAVSLKSPHGAVALENPWALVPSLFDGAYIGGWSAAEHWDLTEQIFASVCVLTAGRIRNGSQVVGGTRFALALMREDRHFGTRPEWVGSQQVAVSDPEKTIIDMLHKPSLGGGIQHTAECFRNLVRLTEGNTDTLVDYAGRFGSGAVNKRLGLLAETMGMDDLAKKLSVKKSAGNIQLDPKNPGNRLVTRWGVWVPTHWQRWVQG